MAAEPLSSPGEPDIHLPVRLWVTEAVLFDADGKELGKVGDPLDLHARRRVRGHAARARLKQRLCPGRLGALGACAELRHEVRGPEKARRARFSDQNTLQHTIK